jgi:hypothetical protein
MSTQVKERVSKVEIRRPHLTSRRLGFSAAEMAAAAAVLLLALAVLYFYFTSLKPEQDKLAQVKLQHESQREVLQKLVTGQDGSGPRKNSIKEALDSLATFQNAHLKGRIQGQRALIDDINALVKKHNSRLMSGLEMSVENTGLEAEKKARGTKNVEESLNVFPKLNMAFTIAGQYPSLRAFINELERNKQFLVINSVTFSALEEADGDTGRRTPTASGLSLTVNLSAYFHP